MMNMKQNILATGEITGTIKTNANCKGDIIYKCGPGSNYQVEIELESMSW